MPPGSVSRFCPGPWPLDKKTFLFDRRQKWHRQKMDANIVSGVLDAPKGAQFNRVPVEAPSDLYL